MLPMLICPNDAEPMENDAWGVRPRADVDITHTCPECGYCEIR